MPLTSVMDTSPRPAPRSPRPAGEDASARAASGTYWDFRGEVPDEVADILDGIRWEYRQAVPNDVAATHLRAILAASAEVGTSPTTRDRWARRLRRVSAIGALKLAAGATAAVAATGSGLAVTGNLPDPAQQVVSDVGARIGLDLPAPEHDTPGDREDGQPGIGRGGVPGLIEDGGDTPGRSGDAPGHTDDDTRGRSGEAPGRTDDGEDAPGRSGEAPGKPSEQGRSDEAPGKPDDAGEPADTPAEDRGRADQAPGQPTEQGRSDDAPGKPADDDPSGSDAATKGGQEIVPEIEDVTDTDDVGTSGRGRPEDRGQH